MKRTIMLLLALALLAAACENPAGGGGGGGGGGGQKSPGSANPSAPVDPSEPVEPTRPVASITVNTGSTKTEYLQNEAFAGAVAAVNYEDGSTETLNTGFGYTYNGQPLRPGDTTITPGTHTITVSFGGRTHTFTITVTAADNLGTKTSTAEFTSAINTIKDGPDDKSYIITVNGNIGFQGVGGPSAYSFGTKRVTVTLKGSGKLYLFGAGVMFVLSTDQTLIIDGPTLEGARQGLNGGTNNNWFSALFVKEGGALELRSGFIQNNYSSGVEINYGGGTFTMTGGTIRNNGHSSSPGGVRIIETLYGVDSRFNMRGGTIENNQGIGVWLDGGSFYMYDGIISGNTHSGVVVQANSTTSQDGYFYMTGGVIKKNTNMQSSPFGGGGVYSHRNNTTGLGGHISKTGNSIIYGKNGGTNSNMAQSDAQGHAILFLESTAGQITGGQVRNTTLGSGVDFNSDTGGPWD